MRDRHQPPAPITDEELNRLGRTLAVSPRFVVIQRGRRMVAYRVTEESLYQYIGRTRPLPHRCSDTQAQGEAREWIDQLEGRRVRPRPSFAGEAAEAA